MVSPDEKYRGYDIHIEHEGHIPATTFYSTMFVVKGDKMFILFCSIDWFTIQEENVNPEDIPSILREAGLKEVRELIDTQQFENKKTYRGDVKFDGKTWRCILSRLYNPVP